MVVKRTRLYSNQFPGCFQGKQQNSANYHFAAAIFHLLSFAGSLPIHQKPPGAWRGNFNSTPAGVMGSIGHIVCHIVYCGGFMV
jgi:hypothetical protein